MHFKKTVSLICCTLLLFFVINSATAFSVKKLPGDSVTVCNYKISSQQFYKLTGKRLNFMQRAKIHFVNKQFNRDQQNKVLQKGPLFPGRRHKHKFNSGWFLLGLAGALLGVVVLLVTFSWIFSFLVALSPVAIAYITGQDDDKKASAKWGTATGILLFFIVSVILFTSLDEKR